LRDRLPPSIRSLRFALCPVARGPVGRDCTPQSRPPVRSIKEPKMIYDDPTKIMREMVKPNREELAVDGELWRLTQAIQPQTGRARLAPELTPPV
jgi:hypothetical protein